MYINNSQWTSPNLIRDNLRVAPLFCEAFYFCTGSMRPKYHLRFFSLASLANLKPVLEIWIIHLNKSLIPRLPNMLTTVPLHKLKVNFIFWAPHYRGKHHKNTVRHHHLLECWIASGSQFQAWQKVSGSTNAAFHFWLIFIETFWLYCLVKHCTGQYYTIEFPVLRRSSAVLWISKLMISFRVSGQPHE